MQRRMPLPTVASLLRSNYDNNSRNKISWWYDTCRLFV